MKILALIAGFACTLPTSAQVLMIDFGPTTVVNPTNSPYHTVNPSFTGSTWNKVGTSDVASGLFWSNNTAVSGITLNLGATTDGTSTTIGLANVPSGSTLTGSAMTSGIYGDTAARDGIFTGGSGTARSVGIQIGGLTAGTYDIYITGRNTNTAGGHGQNFFAGKSSAAGDFDHSALSSRSITYFAAPTTQNAQWSGSGELTNYVKFSVTLTSGEFLNLAARGGINEGRGFLNSVQIVNTSPIPEPATAAMLTGFGALGVGLMIRRRR